MTPVIDQSPCRLQLLGRRCCIPPAHHLLHLSQTELRNFALRSSHSALLATQKPKVSRKQWAAAEPLPQKRLLCSPCPRQRRQRRTLYIHYQGRVHYAATQGLPRPTCDGCWKKWSFGAYEHGWVGLRKAPENSHAIECRCRAGRPNTAPQGALGQAAGLSLCACASHPSHPASVQQRCSSRCTAAIRHTQPPSLSSPSASECRPISRPREMLSVEHEMLRGLACVLALGHLHPDESIPSVSSSTVSAAAEAPACPVWWGLLPAQER